MALSGNVILVDFAPFSGWTFQRALEHESGQTWQMCACVSNQPRRGVYTELLRYLKYFFYPLHVFFQRGRLSKIVAWQQFYGLVFAFYCGLFRVKKHVPLVVMTFIYKEKRGLLGKIYHGFVKKCVNSVYVDKIVCFSEAECARYAALFGAPPERFVFCRLGVDDVSAAFPPHTPPEPERFLLAAGRSNRDYDFLVQALQDTLWRAVILCDTWKKPAPDVAPNVTVRDDVYGDAYLRMLAQCWCVVVPLAQSGVSSGQLCILQAMMLGKPVIATRSSAVEDYVQDGHTGLLVQNTRVAFLDALDTLRADPARYAAMAEAARTRYENCFSVDALGVRVAQLFDS